MRKMYLFLIIGLIADLTFGQRKAVEVSHYVYPEFIKGSVLMKSGVKNEAMLNYNALTEEMIFIKDGKNLAITRLEDIDTVYIGETKFIILKNKFVEILYHNKYDLYAGYKGSIVDPGKPAAYGGTSQTSSVTSYSTFLSNGQAYALQLPEGVETKGSTDYWLKKDGQVQLFVNLRQLARLFEDKSDLFKKYVKENKVKYENEESVVGLIKFMEKN
ncbi:MAG: hypothetical protein WCK18_11395 [Prolixibacteraceae bacterium]